MGTAIQLAEIDICIIGICHQRAQEVTEEFLYNLALPTAKQIVADLCFLPNKGVKSMAIFINKREFDVSLTQ